MNKNGKSSVKKSLSAHTWPSTSICNCAFVGLRKLASAKLAHTWMALPAISNFYLELTSILSPVIYLIMYLKENTLLERSATVSSLKLECFDQTNELARMEWPSFQYTPQWWETLCQLLIKNFFHHGSVNHFSSWQRDRACGFIFW